MPDVGYLFLDLKRGYVTYQNESGKKASPTSAIASIGNEGRGKSFEPHSLYRCLARR
jgi:hypothetical protein